MLRIAHLSYSDASGGAARAAHRIHEAAIKIGLESDLYVQRKETHGDRIHSRRGLAAALSRRTRRLIDRRLNQLIRRSGSTDRHSLGLLRSRWPETLNALDVDIVHLHWICGEMLSIADIARITKPVVWTMHDMWPFCGAEHSPETMRWVDGYKDNPSNERNRVIEANRWVWWRKRKNWNSDIAFVSPSKWLTSAALSSALLKTSYVTTIPNPIDTQLWQPGDTQACRKLAGLPAGVPLIGFGADRVSNPNKGFDLLLEALSRVSKELPDLGVVVFGEMTEDDRRAIACPVYWLGRLEDDISLRAAYSAMDVFVAPSRREAFGQTASEAHACGTPVVAFDNTGLADIVEHGITGYLAANGSVEDLAYGISALLREGRHQEMSMAARNRAVAKFDSRVVGNKYMELYRRIHDENRKTST